MNRPTGIAKWTPADLPKWYSSIPKATLFVIARQLAATVLGSCDDMEAGERGILEEWTAQYKAGNVPQKPAKCVTCDGCGNVMKDAMTFSGAVRVENYCGNCWNAALSNVRPSAQKGGGK